jgi:DNA repair protein RadA/Sms
VADLPGALAESWRTDADSAAAAATRDAKPLPEIDPPSISRLATGIVEFDRVLGGGLVAGSVVLLGGDPGIGKSTLLLQAADRLSASGNRVLYVSSEESAHQVRLRAERLAETGGGAGDSPRPPGSHLLYVLAETNLARIIEQARKVQPAVLVIDSIQMVARTDLEGAPAPGSVAQLRRCCMELVHLAKISGIAVALVGHVTKDGHLAGPKLLEHLVDTVLSFEGDRHHAHRVVRAVKNRFGTTLEIGLFEMTGRGLSEVEEGSMRLDAGASARAGAVICPAMHGTRCLLVEVQALTAAGFLGSARRKASGLDPNRLAMLIAVLEQHGGLRLADQDVFASSVGGLRIVEPAADLALVLAIAGAHFRRAMPPATIALGEVGLGGEVRRVSHLEQRLREAARLGCRAAIIPASHGLNAGGVIRLHGVRTVTEAMEWLSPRSGSGGGEVPIAEGAKVAAPGKSAEFRKKAAEF